MFCLNVFGLMALKYVYASMIKKYDRKKDRKILRPSDYTLYVQKVGRFWTKTDVKQFFEEKCDGVRIVKVNFIYNIKRLYSIIRKWERAERGLTILEMKKKVNKPDYMKKLAKRLAKKKECVKEYFELTKQLNLRDGLSELFSGKCFVTFNTINDTNRALKEMNQQFLKYSYSKTKLNITRAYEPQDYIWHHFGEKLPSVIVLRILSWLLAISIICLNFSVIFFIKSAEKGFNKTNDVFISTLVNFVISRALSSMGFGLRILIKKIVHLEKRFTLTSEHKEKLVKVTIAYFFNTTITLLVVSNIVYDSYLFGTSGLISTILMIQATNIVFKQFWYLIKIQYIFRKLRVLYYRYLNRKKKMERMLQKKLNQSFEGLNYSLSSKYYTVFRTVAVCFFFMTLSPYILLFGICEMGVVFWTQKYILTRRANRPDDIDFTFNIQVIKVFEMMIFLMTVGFFVNEKLVTNKNTSFSIAMMVLGGFEWLIIEIQTLSGCFAQKKKKVNDTEYLEASKNFAVDYDRLNPATQKTAIKKWIKLINDDFESEVNCGIDDNKSDFDDLGDFQNLTDEQKKNNLIEGFLQYYNIQNRENEEGDFYLEKLIKENIDSKFRMNTDNSNNYSMSKNTQKLIDYYFKNSPEDEFINNRNLLCNELKTNFEKMKSRNHIARIKLEADIENGDIIKEESSEERSLRNIEDYRGLMNDESVELFNGERNGSLNGFKEDNSEKEEENDKRIQE